MRWRFFVNSSLVTMRFDRRYWRCSWGNSPSKIHIIVQRFVNSNSHRKLLPQSRSRPCKQGATAQIRLLHYSADAKDCWLCVCRKIKPPLFFPLLLMQHFQKLQKRLSCKCITIKYGERGCSNDGNWGINIECDSISGENADGCDGLYRGLLLVIAVQELCVETEVVIVSMSVVHSLLAWVSSADWAGQWPDY